MYRLADLYLVLYLYIKLFSWFSFVNLNMKLGEIILQRHSNSALI